MLFTLKGYQIKLSKASASGFSHSSKAISDHIIGLASTSLFSWSLEGIKVEISKPVYFR